MIKSNSIVITLLVIIAFLSSCDSKSYYDKVYNFDKEVWHKDSTLLFDVTIPDSLQVYNVFINNRNSGQYNYSNLYMFVTTKLPNNEIIRDTLECILADQTGKWLGKGFGNIWSNKITYRKNIRFPYSGNYQFTIEQAMRDDELKHILDAGLRIEKAN